jgi:hypothetical protein
VLALALGLDGSLAYAAQVAGTIVNLSGPLMVRKADGSVKVLAMKSEVEQGDTLVAEKNTYAQIRFVDNSEITLRPGTTFKVDAFAYDSARPEGDSASFTLVKGGLRSITGLLGKRSRDKFEMRTPAATIGIRGTTFTVQYVEPLSALPVAPRPGTLAPGLYVQVIDGMIFMNSGGGTQNFSAGQFGFTPNPTSAPLIVPANPGLKFTPPPTFSMNTVGPANPASANSSGVDCEVR